jgi:hypothetical protein
MPLGERFTRRCGVIAALIASHKMSKSSILIRAYKLAVLHYLLPPFLDLTLPTYPLFCFSLACTRDSLQVLSDQAGVSPKSHFSIPSTSEQWPRFTRLSRA